MLAIKSTKTFLLCLSIVSCSLLLSSCHAFRLFAWGPPDDKDLRHFHTSTVNPSDSVFYFIKAERDINLPDSVMLNGSGLSTDDFIEKSKTTAFIIIRNDTVIFEQYYENYTSASIVPMFSITKTFIGALVGIACKEGLIESVHDPIGKYLPDLKDTSLHSVTIQHLLNMRSGIRFSNDYWNPFGRFSQLHFGNNFSKYVIDRSRSRYSPGERYTYNQLDVQLLGEIISRSTGKTVTQYTQEKIWKPLGMQYPAYWNLDSKKHGMENCGSGLSLNPIDLAKLARLYLKNGTWNGTKLLDQSWVDSSVKIDSATRDFYVTYLWKHTLIKPDSSQNPATKDSHENADDSPFNNLIRVNDYFSVGMGSQRILYVYPEKNLIIIKLSKGYRYQNTKQILHELSKEIG